MRQRTLEMLLKACDDEVMKETPAFMRHKDFRKGLDSVNNYGRSGNSSKTKRTNRCKMCDIFWRTMKYLDDCRVV
ncbi:hypothetical protein TNCT_482321 [Trichonephila clavata]|uniref:Uncharacterized protein n=1 Tax=Trichonephila clavata TaxID=2740835 RepID=A0A8X6KPT4_TRICU|nr:hypothetical protein TNCT_482321 [Trichonephila clavata]